VPLRSVEAASRDDAIAAAREQFGPSARVVGVRRVRSGGVLGFFATERYVAEVAPDPGIRPPVPASGRSAAEVPASSPLASAAAATARPTAPARNGAAAYAAAAGSSPAELGTAARQDSPARPAAVLRTLSAADPAPRSVAAADEARLSELVGLLAAEAEPPAPAPAYGRAAFPRATVVRSAREASPAYLDHEDDVQDGDEAVDEPVIAPAAPSPFTAALARMVSGDRDVRLAVEEALEQPATASARTDVGPWPTWSGPIRTTEPSVPSPPARQKEETVGDQVIAPPSMPAAQPAEVPVWAAEPDTAAAPSREEAIAEVLRSALAQGHSDEALAGILRKVLAGASPQTALPEPQLDEPRLLEPAPVLDDVVLPNVVADLALDDDLDPAREAAMDTAIDLPVVRLPLPELPLPELPVAELPGAELPATDLPVPDQRVELFAPAPVAAALPALPDWVDSASQSSLWGESAAVPNPVHADSPIWAEVVRHEPVEAVVEAVVEQAPWSLFGSVPPAPAESVAVEEVAAATVIVEAVETAVLETAVPETAVPETVVVESPTDAPAAEEVTAAAEVQQPLLELAPLLARTASDPAPMSLDETSVMPPLSLLPPLPGTRGRGRPPVPPVAPRIPSGRPATPSVPSEASASASAVAPAPEPETAVVDRSLATVTRLPLAPLTATPETPDRPVLADRADVPAPALAESPVEIPAEGPLSPEVAVVPAVTPARPVVRAARRTTAEPGDVVAQLAELGLPTELLGSTFAEEVAAYGTYAALTRALRSRLPHAPEVPTAAGDVLFLVGPGVETLRAARSLAASLRLDPDRVQWATRGDLAGLAPESSRMTSIDAAIARRSAATGALTLTIVAVDAPLRTDTYWMAQMLGIWSPVAVWAVVEATRKPDDLEPWLEGLSRVDALVVQDTDLSTDPAAVLGRLAVPVAILDGVRATPHRWASLLCERLEGTQS
jgi:hypothetical protein